VCAASLWHHGLARERVVLPLHQWPRRPFVCAHPLRLPQPRARGVPRGSQEGVQQGQCLPMDRRGSRPRPPRAVVQQRRPPTHAGPNRMACHRSAKLLIGRGAFRRHQSCHLHRESSQDYWGRGQGRVVCLARVQVAPLFLGVGVLRHLVGPSRLGVACRRWVEQVA
jgi:hypothetical protein